MMYLFPPLPPEPHRSFFKTDEAYHRALSAHRRIKHERDEMMKSHEAFMILLAIILIGITASIVLFFFYMIGGVKGILYAFAAAGLLWVAYEQIRSRL